MKIINVMASSVDGKISLHPFEADESRRRYGFTNIEDQSLVRDQLLDADAVITGANSMRASTGAWNLKNRKGRFPTWIVLSNRGLEQNLRFFSQTEIPRWLVSRDMLPNQKFIADSGVKNVIYGNANPAEFIVGQLNSDPQISTVLLFGGGEINAMFYEKDLVDELKLTVSPMIIAAKSASSLVAPSLSKPRHLRLLSSNVNSSHVFLTYKILK